MVRKTSVRESRVLAWYQELLSRRVDLVGDYAGNELFLVEGDSLLLHCFSDSKIDFGDGFQLLHAAHAVEAFLHNLARRNCNFHIAFFDRHQELCIPPGISYTARPKYSFARAAIVRHLRTNLERLDSPIKVEVFPSLDSQAFTKYLESTGVYFVMCHDGAFPKPTERWRDRVIRRGMIRHFISQGYNVALINGLEWRDTKVITVVLEHASTGVRWRKNSQANNKNTKHSGSGADGSELDDTLESDAGEHEDDKESTNDSASGGGTDEDSVDEDCKDDGTFDEDEFDSAEAFQNHPQISDLLSLRAADEMTEREFITVLALSRILSRDPSQAAIATALLLHTAYLRCCPLPARRVTAVPATGTTRDFLTMFLRVSKSLLLAADWDSTMAAIMERRGSRDTLRMPCSDIVDLADGRILNAVLSEVRLGINTSRLDPDLRKTFETLLKATESLCIRKPITLDFESPVSSFQSEHVTVVAQSTGLSLDTSLSVMPFTNYVFDVHLEPVRLSIQSSASTSSSDRSSKIFQELSHWHDAKRPITNRAAAVPKLGFHAHRRNQRFMAEMMAYAASLTNGVGKSLEPETIVTIDPRSHGKSASTGTGNEKPAAKNADHEKGAAKANKKSNWKTGKSAALESAAAFQKGKAEVRKTKILQACHQTLKGFDSEMELKIRYSRAQRYLHDLSEFDLAVVGTEVGLYMLSCLLELWISYCADDLNLKCTAEALGVAAMIWDAVTSFSRRDNTSMTRTIASCIELTTTALALPSINIKLPIEDRPLTWTFSLQSRGKMLTDKIDLSIPLLAKDFQLLHCGPYFDRSIDSAPDARVPFEPDGWQRKVLDAIDAKQSLFVVAPTSAGKTFISFYAMKQILESDDEDVLVYVAPTKALVNQIAAEVQARFSKSFRYPGKSVWGIHTRDFRINNPTGCQILVTVPHILQIMLLAPSNAEKKNSWSGRVRRIIFDEIHCIGQAEDGIVWEQLLLLSPCPIIALSATVGNPAEFNDWLSSTQRAVGNHVVMVQHAHRYSDLRKFVYMPPRKFHFRGLPERKVFTPPGLDGTQGFAFMHPVAALVNRSRGMPDDLNLEARDCLTLWKSMVKHENKEYTVAENLDPSKALPDVVRKSDIIKWEHGLKKVLKEWMAEINSPFSAVLDELSTAMHGTQEEFVVSTDATDDGVEPRVINAGDLCATTLPLLTKLHEQDALPAIFFNYDRSLCEDICRSLLSQLKEAEQDWKDSSLKWKHKVAEWERWKQEQEKVIKKMALNAGKKKAGNRDSEAMSKAEVLRETASAEVSVWSSFDPNTPVDGFHFADYKRLAASELAEYTKQLARRDVPRDLIEALGRGIAVHHAGCNRKYRQVVEVLFRKGYLRAVIATGTLALGINMPCKTVVFSGDSVFLTALNYRQAAGRAGRRGFDVLGNVVFQGIPPNKVCRLLSSRLPDLNGHFPITTTLVLRLFTLLHESKNSEYAVKAITALLSQPRLYLGSAESKMTVLHHLRFSIEYLRRQHLLSAGGAPLNFAGCVSHLYFTENSSFAFHALLKEGYFHNLCSAFIENPTQVTRTLMLVMAHLFGRHPCRQSDQEYIDRVVKRSPSIVFLPPLPKDAAAVLRSHNQETLRVFSTYVETFVDQHVQDTDRILPLTSMMMGGSSSSVSSMFSHAIPPTKIRSAFVALSGHGDNFESISDLCRTVRNGVFLEEAVIPHVGIYPEESEVPLNAYLYDFYMHGDVTALVKANGVRRGDVWFVLNDFSLILRTITTSLMNFMKLSPGTDLDMIDVMGGGDIHEEQLDDRMAKEPALTQPNDTQTKAPAKAKNKGKVVESWDADEEDEQPVGTEHSNGTSSAVPEELWKVVEEKGLMTVLKAFQKLQNEFDEKFKVMWA